MALLVWDSRKLVLAYLFYKVSGNAVYFGVSREAGWGSFSTQLPQMCKQS